VGWIRAVLREVLGLFVDDGSFALAILVWVGLVWMGAPRLGLSAGAGGAVLFAGLGMILVESTMRYSRRKRSAARAKQVDGE